MIGSDHTNGANFSQTGLRTRRRLLDALLAEVMAHVEDIAT